VTDPEPDPYPTPAPTPAGLNADWYRLAAQGQLHFQRCSACGSWRHPPRVLCAECGSAECRWEPSAGRGHLFSWTVTHQPLHPDFADQVPYAVVVVELDEGPRIVCSVRDIANEALALDLPVTIGLARLSVDIALPYARPDVPRPDLIDHPDT
jgi:uncharacterized OB-fold protein